MNMLNNKTICIKIIVLHLFEGVCRANFVQYILTRINCYGANPNTCINPPLNSHANKLQDYFLKNDDRHERGMKNKFCSVHLFLSIGASPWAHISPTQVKYSPNSKLPLLLNLQKQFLT